MWTRQGAPGLSAKHQVLKVAAEVRGTEGRWAAVNYQVKHNKSGSTHIPYTLISTHISYTLISIHISYTLISTHIPNTLISTHIPYTLISIHISYTLISIHISYTLISTHIPYTLISTHISYTLISTHIPYTLISTHISYTLISTHISCTLISTHIPYTLISTHIPYTLISTHISYTLISTHIPYTLISTHISYTLISTHISYTLISTHIPYTLISTHIPYTLISTHISYTLISTHIPYTLISTHIPYTLISLLLRLCPLKLNQNSGGLKPYLRRNNVGQVSEGWRERSYRGADGGKPRRCRCAPTFRSIAHRTEPRALRVRHWKLLRCCRQILRSSPPPTGIRPGRMDEWMLASKGPALADTSRLWWRLVRQTERRTRGTRQTRAEGNVDKLQWLCTRQLPFTAYLQGVFTTENLPFLKSCRRIINLQMQEIICREGDKTSKTKKSENNAPKSQPSDSPKVSKDSRRTNA
ncbi:hypothetical protein P4O66_002962 [Electrophorus voltai]|uniref:Uncharacterized protein n=1 Tax=Electrophorus voltai TaxID=2609070 RepID=A0AAD8YSU1_9TELE|nr:hypothetical protein P4O66_002962 [Electrophorus voltai]